MTHLLPAIAWTLIHFCWQAAAIAALYGVAGFFLTRSSSQTRYAFTLSALLAMLLAAAITFAWQLQSALPSTSADSALASLPNRFQASIAPALQPHLYTSPESSPSAATSPALPWIVAFWLLGVFLLSLRSLGGWWIIRRLRASASSSAIPATARSAFDRIVDTIGIGRPVDLAVSNSIPGPLTIGFLRATVLLPLSAITALGPEELEVVLAHELAHVRRADFLWNLVQTFAETLFFFHPAVWWIGSCLRAERELCCDDLALRLCPNPVAYASALFRLEEQRTRQPRLAMALAGDRSPSTLRNRILRILGEPVAQVVPSPSRAFSISVTVAALALLILPSSQVLATLRPVHAAVLAPAANLAASLPSPALSSAVMPSSPSSDAAAVPQETAPAKPPASHSSAPISGSTYIDRMKAAGYDVDLDKYIALKVQDITPEYARDMNQAGFGKLSADDLIACKVQGVTPQYITALKQQGLNVTSVHDAVSFRIFEVTPEFIAGMKEAGFPGLSTHQLIALRSQGVTPDYARSVAQQFPGLTAEDLVKAKIFNIDSDFIASAKAHGFSNLKFEKLVQLRISGLLDDESVKP